MTGDLTMRGVTHSVVLAVDGPTEVVKGPWGNASRGVSATGTLKRTAWGLVWNKALEAGGVLVGEDVQLIIDAELVAKAPAAK